MWKRRPPPPHADLNDTDRSRSPIAEKLLAPLGRVVATCDVLEFYLAIFLSELTSVDNAPEQGYRTRPFGKLIDLFDKAFKERVYHPLIESSPRWDTLPDEWPAMKADLDDVCDRRNDLVHAFWVGVGRDDEGSTNIRVHSDGKKFMPRTSFVDAAMMLELVDAMEWLGPRFLEFSAAVEGYVTVWRRRTGRV